MPSPKHRFAADPFLARNVWLAGLGLFSITRRNAIETAQRAASVACRLRADAGRLAGDVRNISRGVAMTARERVEPMVAVVGRNVKARVADVFSRQKEARDARPAARKPRPSPNTAPRQRAAAKRV